MPEGERQGKARWGAAKVDNAQRSGNLAAARCRTSLRLGAASSRPHVAAHGPGCRGRGPRPRGEVGDVLGVLVVKRLVQVSSLGGREGWRRRYG